jgi:uncharacterized protein
MNIATVAAIGLVRLYQVTLSPLKTMFFGTAQCCRFTPSCSCYALEAFRVHGFCRGGIMAARRILRCHPWGGAGHDPVPPSPMTGHISRA